GGGGPRLCAGRPPWASAPMASTPSPAPTSDGSAITAAAGCPGRATTATSVSAPAPFTSPVAGGAADVGQPVAALPPAGAVLAVLQRPRDLLEAVPQLGAGQRHAVVAHHDA